MLLEIEPRVDLDQVVDYILEREGGLNTVNVENDAGGLTNYGISSRYNPDIDIPNLTRERAAELWMERYVMKWSTNEGVLLSFLTQQVAEKLTDYLAPRNHIREAIQLLQGAVRAARIADPGPIDGIWGSRSQAAFDETVSTSPDGPNYSTKTGEDLLLACLRSEIAGAYRIIVLRYANQQANLEGWLNRAYSV